MDDTRFSPSLVDSGLVFLFNEINIAMLMLDSASITRYEDAARRRIRLAHEAYETVQRLLLKLELNRGQRREIEEKLAVLKARMEAIVQKPLVGEGCIREHPGRKPEASGFAFIGANLLH